MIGSIRAMNDLSEVRRANLNAYCLRQGWVSAKNPEAGSPQELVTRVQRTSSFWSDRLRGTKPIGAELAREIEQKLGLPKYSLDGDEETSDFVPVGRLSVEVGAGPGRLVSIVEEVGKLHFRRDFLRAAGVSGNWHERTWPRSGPNCHTKGSKTQSKQQLTSGHRKANFVPWRQSQSGPTK